MKNTELRSTARQPGLRFRDYLLERQRPRSNHGLGECGLTHHRTRALSRRVDELMITWGPANAEALHLGVSRGEKSDRSFQLATLIGKRDAGVEHVQQSPRCPDLSRSLQALEKIAACAVALIHADQRAPDVLQGYGSCISITHFARERGGFLV